MNDVVIIGVPELELPKVLGKFHGFRELSDSKQQAFLQRLRYIQEIPFKLEEWDVHSSGERLQAIVDRIELDVMINVGLSGDSARCVSPWLIHSSWTAEVNVEQLLHSLPPDLQVVLDRSIPTCGSQLQELNAWIGETKDLLSLALSGFFRSVSIEECLSNLMVIDTLLLQIYLLLLKLRFRKLY